MTDLYYNGVKVSTINILSTTTVNQLKQTLNNWLIPQGITNYTVRLFFNNNTELTQEVFMSNTYDGINFQVQANLLPGSKIYINSTVLPIQTNKKETYIIHDNYTRPFKVEIKGNSVLVYTKGDNYLVPILNLKARKVFIGKSPETMTTMSGGDYGPEFDGNTILVNTDNNNYIFIGDSIYSFASLDEIVTYISPVGNNDVPYPYGFDKLGNTYYMSERVYLDKKHNVNKEEDVVMYFYSIGDTYAKPMKNVKEIIKGGTY